MRLVLLFLLTVLSICSHATELGPVPREYFEAQLALLENQLGEEVRSKSDWEARKEAYRRELKEMLGIEPEPPRGDLAATIVGTLEGPGIVVEKLHFQPLPQFYVAANFFRPKEATGKLPTILYVCGHGDEMGKDGRSNGNKTHYQHHGIWFAQHGYNCLVIDTVQWGEFLGDHHGTYRLNRWWWTSRGYTPAGLETWTSMRALDYLATRPEVDMNHIGVTGRSGGGAYSWFLTAVDDRVKVSCPTAGITTLRDHILTGCVEGHCDCMYFLNLHRWDYDKLAALAAPRPLLISNTDKDNIFPLGGVMSIYQDTRRIYELLGAVKNIGLQFAEGPHHDSQPLYIGALHWFDRFLKGKPVLASIREPAEPYFDKDALRVFTDLPKDAINLQIDEVFVPKAAPAVPTTKDEWERLKNGWKDVLGKIFAFAPELKVPDPQALRKPNHHMDRRLLLLGIAPDALETVKLAETGDFMKPQSGTKAAMALYAALLKGYTGELRLSSMPSTHEAGPFFPGVLKHFDLPQAVALAAETMKIRLTGNKADFQWTLEAARNLGFAENLEVVPEVEVVSVKKIWDQAQHQAFTDLLEKDGTLYCVFREGSGHVPGTDGIIRVLTSRDGDNWESAAVIQENGVDLRDAKISLIPDGRLMMLMGGSFYDGESNATAKRRCVRTQSRVSFSADGKNWTPPQPIAAEQDWLWRVTWHQGTGYGVSYRTGVAAQDVRLTLWKTPDGLNFESIGQLRPERHCWPNETTLRILPTGEMMALVRNEQNAGPAYIGRCADFNTQKPTWTWTNARHAAQGPNFLVMPDGTLFYSGRAFESSEAKTVFGKIQNDILTPLLTLPSGGDTSYPGMVHDNKQTLWLSYYASHEGKTAIYIAKLKWNP